MNAKMAIGACAAALAALSLTATPSTNTLEAVKADWWNGSFTNVYERAEARMSSNSNDLVAAYLMMEYHTAFSSRAAASNAVMRLVEISDGATLPAYTNLYWATRAGWIRYANTYIPSRTDAQWDEHRQRMLVPHRTMTSCVILEILEEGGLW